jgi:hypothetical protein
MRALGERSVTRSKQLMHHTGTGIRGFCAVSVGPTLASAESVSSSASATAPRPPTGSSLCSDG